MVLDMGSCTWYIVCDNSCSYHSLVLCGVSLILPCCSLTILTVIDEWQSYGSSPTSDGHAPHTCCPISRITAIVGQHSACWSSPDTYANASLIHCLPTTHTSLSPNWFVHVHWPVALRSMLPQGCGREFEQVRACVCRPHWRRVLGQHMSRESSCGRDRVGQGNSGKPSSQNVSAT